MAEEQVQETSVEPTPPPVAAEPPPVETAPEPETPPEPPKTEEQHGNKGRPAWYMTRISEESSAKRAAEERAQAAERRAQEAEALLQRMQTAPQTTTTTPQNAPPARSPVEQAPQDRRAEIAAEAARQRLYEDSMDVRNKGVQQFGSSFGETLGILQAVGATTDDFVADVLAVDRSNAHVLLDKIAKDPERAVTLAQMTSRQRIAELTRLNMAAVAPKTETEKPVEKKTVSKAPPPPPPVTPNATKTIDWRSADGDKMTDAEWNAAFNADEKLKARNFRR